MSLYLYINPSPYNYMWTIFPINKHTTCVTLWSWVQRESTWCIYHVLRGCIGAHWSASAMELLQSCTKPSIWPYDCLITTLQWRHNGRDGVPNHQPRHCLLNRLFRRRSNKTSYLRVTGLCEGNSPLTGELPAQMASNAENVSIWWRHHVSKSNLKIFY